jgi:cell division protein ZapA (FtsZ GTPase activity inhibitor)
MDPGGLTPWEVQSLATFVDEKMREIAQDLSIVDTQKVAVLASINIALDYLQLKEKKTAKNEDLTEQVQEWDNVLMDALNYPSN